MHTIIMTNEIYKLAQRFYYLKDDRVYVALYLNPNSCREDLAKITGYRLQKTCCCINQLLSYNRIFVSGYKINTKNQECETLRII